jgi:hypothetical protein
MMFQQWRDLNIVMKRNQTTGILSNWRFQQQGHLVTDGNPIFSNRDTNMLGIRNTEESIVLATERNLIFQ